MIQTEKRMRLCTALLICNLIFIWGNSLLPGSVSGAISDAVKAVLEAILPGEESDSSGGFLLRKAAHFTEFAALGMLFAWLFGMLQRKKLWPFVCGAAVACVDETIQRFIPGRGPSIRDVCIDSCGVLTGMLLLYIGHTYYKKRSAKQSWRICKMKKLLSVFLALTMTVTMLSACGKKETAQTEATTVPATTVPAATVEGTLEELLNRVVEERPVEFMGGVTTIDLTDTSEDGLWILKNCTGLDSADRITEAAVFEPMIGSIAFSMVMVRVAPGESTRTVAEAMKSGVDPRKWICVEADDLLVTGYADVVMLIMVSTSSGMTAQSFVDAFQKVVGGEPEFTI